MLSLTQTTGYAILALSCLEDNQARPCLIRDIAERTGLRKPYLAKIFNQLAHYGLVDTKRGYRGGIVLSRPPAAITLLQILEAVEGDQWLGPCLLGMDKCESTNCCPTQHLWQDIAKRITQVLRKTTLADMIQAGAQRNPLCKPGVCGSRPGGASRV